MCLLLEIHAPAIKNKDMTTRKYLFANFTTPQEEYLMLNVEWQWSERIQKNIFDDYSVLLYNEINHEWYIFYVA